MQESAEPSLYHERDLVWRLSHQPAEEPTSDVLLCSEAINYEHTIRDTSVSSAKESDGSSTENTISTSARTIADYFSYCREVCTWSVECKLATDGKIGGVGMTVEIDESRNT